MRKYMARLSWAVTASATVYLSLAFSPALADEGRIPIYQPTTITEPGRYIVTRDFTSPGIAVLIQANDVTLDLDGHTLTGPPGCGSSTDLITIDTALATEGIVIRNGRTLYGCSGIYANPSNRLRVRIEDVEVSNPSDTGILILAAESAEVRRCHVHDGLAGGIIVLGSVAAFHGRFVDNMIERVALQGMVLNGLASGEVRGNVITDFGSDAANMAGLCLAADLTFWAAGGNIVEENTVSGFPSGSDDDGIRVDVFSAHNVLVGNVARRNGRYGIWSRGDETRLERNLTSRNGSHGIRVGDGAFGVRNHLEWNQSQGNTGAGTCGVSFDNGATHVYRNNTLRGNPVAGFCGAANTDGGGNFP